MLGVVTSDFVKVVVTNSVNSDACTERKFLKSITVADLKGKLELLTGGSAATMKLEVYQKDSDQLVCKLEDDDALLGSYPIDDGMRLHVVDKFILRNALADTDQVEKFELSSDEYAKRTGTVKEFLEKNRLGKYNAEERKMMEEKKKAEDEAEEKAAKAINVGDRCEVTIVNAPKRRATVMFVGHIEGKKGWWVGVKYDEPLGKNDGSIGGKRYFQCPPNYGGFAKPASIKVGDYPEEDYDLDEI